jgi:hypothetical protein
MEFPNENNFVNLLKTIIRYFASGFIFIVVFKFLNGENDIWRFTADNINWSLVLIAAICGLLLYAFHAAILDDLFYRLSLNWLKRRKDQNDFWPESFNEFDTSKIIFTLNTERYKRLGTRKRKLRAVQDRLEQLYMLLVLLYTSAFSLITIPIGFSLYNFFHYKVCFEWKFFLVMIVGVLFCLIGFVLDLKLTKRELYMEKNRK